MKITEIELFDPLEALTVQGRHLDFHNEFDCVGFEYLQQNDQLSFNFTGIATNEKIVVVYTKVEMAVFNFKLEKAKGLLTLDSMYRGRYLENNVVLDEKEGKGYVYIDFLEGLKFEFFSEEFLVEFL